MISVVAGSRIRIAVAVSFTALALLAGSVSAGERVALKPGDTERLVGVWIGSYVHLHARRGQGREVIEGLLEIRKAVNAKKVRGFFKLGPAHKQVKLPKGKGSLEGFITDDGNLVFRNVKDGQDWVMVLEREGDEYALKTTQEIGKLGRAELTVKRSGLGL